jgi:pyruvate/2-oxoglutarate dehydrogenase complex dihydrolipoamide dehydrogenase (E3) component
MSRRNVIVIGGGPAGVDAATAAAAAGAVVTLVSESAIGGRAGWDSLLPSKLWLQVAAAAGPAAEPAAVAARITAAARRWSAHEQARLTEAGVTVLAGAARFLNAQTVAVSVDGADVRQLTADAVIVATGSQPRFPAGLKPDGKDMIAPRHLSMLTRIPPALAVIGGGATGAEAASLFVALGSRVSWFSGPDGALAGWPGDAGRRLEAALAARGVTVIHQGIERGGPDGDELLLHAADGTQHRVPMAFLAVGRRADLDRLNLDAAGLRAPLTVDGFGRSAQPPIYAVGDAVGGTMLANRAVLQGWIAGRAAAGAAVAPLQPQLVVQAVYATPELAWVGSPDGRAVRVDSRSLMKAVVSDDPLLELDLFTAADGTLRGGLAVGPHAAEVLNVLAPALAGGLTAAQLAAVAPAAPTYAELIAVAARAAAAAASGE